MQLLVAVTEGLALVAALARLAGEAAEGLAAAAAAVGAEDEGGGDLLLVEAGRTRVREVEVQARLIRPGATWRQRVAQPLSSAARFSSQRLTEKLQKADVGP